MRKIFVETQNAVRLWTAFSALETRGAEEACLIVVDGKPGHGKTTTLRHWVAKTGSVYVCANEDWSTSWMWNDILGQLGVAAPHSKEAKFGAVVKELGHRLSMATRQAKPFALIIDEADHISKKRKLIEAIRSVTDLLELPTVLVGMGNIRTDLIRFPQVASRVCGYVHFDRATTQDVRKFFDGLCTVPVADDLVSFVHNQSLGFNREIKEAIAKCERFAKLNPPGGGKALTMADMAGQVILNDRATGNPITVPEVL